MTVEPCRPCWSSPPGTGGAWRTPPRRHPATASSTAANDRPDYVTTTADWALAPRRTGVPVCDDDIKIKVPPADAVGRPDPTYAVARPLETHVGRHVTVHRPVEVVEGPDGFVEMTEPRTIAPSWPRRTSSWPASRTAARCATFPVGAWLTSAVPAPGNPGGVAGCCTGAGCEVHVARAVMIHAAHSTLIGGSHMLLDSSGCRSQDSFTCEYQIRSATATMSSEIAEIRR